MKRKPRAYSREKRKAQIIGQFNIWHSKNDTEPKTMQRIAKALDLVPSHRVTLLLLEMVEEGKLTFEERDKSGRWTGRYYQVVSTLIGEKFFARRKIAVRNRGQVVGQMEMML
jgi:hypothetical protein